MLTSYGTGYSTTASSETFIVFTPLDYVKDQTRRAVIICHGLLGTPAQWRTQLAEARAFAEAGFPCIIAELGGVSTWGNDTAQTRLSDAWRYMKRVWGVKPDQCVLYTQSMGNVAGMNWARHFSSNVAAIAGEVPVISLDDVHDRNPSPGTFAGLIEGAYTDLATYNAAQPTHDPYANLTTHAALDIPTEYWAATDDIICLYSIAQAFEAGGACTLHSIGTGGHQVLPSQFYDDVVDFLRPYVLP